MKAVIIGAGSGFGSRLSIDIMSREPISDSTICLCDLDMERLEKVRDYVSKVAETHGLGTKFEISTDRRELLPDADFVIIAVSIGGPAYFGKPFEYEIKIPEKYGIVQRVGDTVGPGGLFRGLRSAPALLEMVDDVNELAPASIILNYTNPMAILTWAMSEAADVQVTGLCHGVQGTSKRIADFINVPYDEFGFSASGINHMAWFTGITHNKKDMYPALFKAMEDPEIYAKDSVRFDLMKNFGYFCTESSHHSYEYIPYYMHNEEMKKKMTREVKPAEVKQHGWLEDMGIKIEQAGSMDLVRSHEYASGIMESVVTNIPFSYNGNVLNNDLLPSLPPGSCVEVPVLVDRQGLHPCRVDDLPEQCAALCRTNVNMQTMAVQAIFERDREAAFQSVLLDPITSACLGFKEAREMFDEMWKAEEEMGLLEYYR